jgi:dihydrofolate synthase/folylpolyglutamate synthase
MMDTSAEQIRQSLFALTSRGIKYDLQRVSAASARIGNPHNRYSSIHVAGTNGKGSTCAYIESILRAGGCRTGLFISPHLIAFEERFSIDGITISEKEWIPVYDDLHEVIMEYKLTFFEATMLIAIELFRRHAVEWAVFETGMGGRLDATNILHPRVTVITRIAMDHREYLGSTIEEIAGEKLGIVKEQTPLVIADPVDDRLRALILDTCRQKRAACTFIAGDMAILLQENVSGISFTWRGIPFSSRMTGQFQVINALCAIEAVRQSGFQADTATYQKGIASTSLPGRFQIMTVCGKTVVIDVGHNPDAAAVFCATLRRQFTHETICIITGIMADKDYPAMIKQYAETAQHIVFTRPKTGRAASAETLAHLAPEEKRTVCPDVKDAVREALHRPESLIAVVGSFYTAGEAIIAFAAETR